jgi:glyoxylase-like metal-dependent hydrolase (beta-lactamase superfamily II)
MPSTPSLGLRKDTVPEAIFSVPVAVTPDLSVATISNGGKSCHLLLSGGSSLLVNCIARLKPSVILAAGHPVPEEIWHTQVDDTLAAEGNDFEALIRLPASFAEVARASEDYWKKARTTWEHPEEWMVTFGRETYGVAGSLIVQPLSRPLPGFQTFKPGDFLEWRGFRFRVLDFSVRNFYSVGFALERVGETLALFSGDLVEGSGRLPDAHGFESNYAGLPWDRIASTLSEAAALKPAWMFPCNGGPVENPASLLDQLAVRVGDFLNFTQTLPKAFPQKEPPRFGRYHDHGDSVYQIANFGNTILFINPEGFGFMIDPGPCDYGNPSRKEDFVADLEMFEAEAGLKAIDLVLVTHFHGDHYDLWPEVQQRYPECRLGAWGPIADVIEHPEEYSYPALLPWYDVGWKACGVDLKLTRQSPLLWHGTAIHTVHLPGHCLLHAGYWLDWNGRRILLSGDSIQTRGEADALQMPCANHSVPGTEEGHAQAYRNVIPLGIDLNLGGHSSHFQDCRDIYNASFERIEQTTDLLLELFPKKSSSEIFLRDKGDALRGLNGNSDTILIR